MNFNHATVRVTHKPDRGWTPKAYKERQIPLPERLAKSLKAWKAKATKACPLVFPTAGCNPKLDFLDCPKTAAERAKLNEEKHSQLKLLWVLPRHFSTSVYHVIDLYPLTDNVA